MSIDGKPYFFDGVKDMMKYYIFDADFPYDRKKIDSMKVSDFYTLDAIDPKKAYFVIGSNVYGPMGNELIAFGKKSDAENFMHDHKGEKILRFDEITPQIVMALDGLVYEEPAK
jgi:nitrous oxide reductase accessory protein NosL